MQKLFQSRGVSEFQYLMFVLYELNHGSNKPNTKFYWIVLEHVPYATPGCQTPCDALCDYKKQPLTHFIQMKQFVQMHHLQIDAHRFFIYSSIISSIVSFSLLCIVCAVYLFIYLSVLPDTPLLETSAILVSPSLVLAA